jgi:hypothetical protein
LIIFNPVIVLPKLLLFKPENVSVSPFEFGLKTRDPLVVEPAYRVKLLETAVAIFANCMATAGDDIFPKFEISTPELNDWIAVVAGDDVDIEPPA